MNFLAELRKRNVFRVAAAYLVGAWIVMQVVGLIASATGLPDWTDTMVLIILIAGFPIVALAAWALELTPEGIKPSGTETETEVRPRWFPSTSCSRLRWSLWWDFSPGR